MSEKRFQAMEEKLAFFEMASADMGEEIFRQQQEIEALTKAHQSLLQRVELLQESTDQDVQDNNERPPHYYISTTGFKTIIKILGRKNDTFKSST